MEPPELVNPSQPETPPPNWAAIAGIVGFAVVLMMAATTGPGGVFLAFLLGILASILAAIVGAVRLLLALWRGKPVLAPIGWVVGGILMTIVLAYVESDWAQQGYFGHL